MTTKVSTDSGTGSELTKASQRDAPLQEPSVARNESAPPSGLGEGDKPKNDTDEIIRRLRDRHKLMEAAINPKYLTEYAKFAVQTHSGPLAGVDAESSSNKDVATAVQYRLGITDLFVEKAQFHLEQRAKRYEFLGYGMYFVALLLLGVGATIAVWRMFLHEGENPTVIYPLHPWIDLLSHLLRAFTGYGLIVATAVALARGARACLDQRERLLAKRHSLRQGRLYLHLTGGHVTIDEMERAFNWNHSQDNAFTHMPTDTKAPMGAVAEEVVKMIPDILKVAVAATQGAAVPQKKSTGSGGTPV